MLPDMGVSSFLGDTNYHRPMRPGVHAPLEVKGIRWVAVTKIRAQGKAFDKVRHPLMIKILNKVGIEGLQLIIIKAIYNKPPANSLMKS